MIESGPAVVDPAVHPRFEAIDAAVQARFESVEPSVDRREAPLPSHATIPPTAATSTALIETTSGSIATVSRIRLALSSPPMERSEKQKMLAGELYRASDPELVAERRRCRSLLQAFNAEPDEERRLGVLRELLERVGSGSFVQPPFACDYGTNLSIGDNVFVNFNCVILDCAEVTIGDGTQIGPGVQLLAADHPRDAETRRDLLELARPISIGSNVWIGGAALVLPGVTIGDDAIIGAGSVVTRDVPSGVLAVGNPCRVVREL